MHHEEKLVPKSTRRRAASITQHFSGRHQDLGFLLVQTLLEPSDWVRGPTKSGTSPWKRKPIQRITAYHVATREFPEVKLRKLVGSCAPSRLCLNSFPNVKLRRLLGRWVLSTLWPKFSPNVKLCRLLGSWMPSRLWLTSFPKVKLWRLLGRWVLPRLARNFHPTSNSADCWVVGCPPGSR